MALSKYSTAWHHAAAAAKRRVPKAGASSSGSTSPFGGPVKSTSKSYGSGIAGQYQKALDEAKAANEERYGEIKGGYQERYDTAMGDLEGLGAQQRKDLGKQYSDERAKTRSYLSARGLSGTTLAPTMEQGSIGKEQESMTRLNEALKRERLGYQTGLSGDKLGFMERREDVGPDMGMLSQLAYGEGTAGGGGGGGYGGINLGSASMRNSIAAARGYSGQTPNREGVRTSFPGIGYAQAPRTRSQYDAAKAAAVKKKEPVAAAASGYGPLRSGYKALTPAKESYLPKMSWQA